MLETALLLSGLALGAAGCTAAVPTVMPDCDYGGQKSDQEFVFVLPSFEEYVSETGAFEFYSEPRRAAKLRLSSFRYNRDYVGRKYKRVGTVDGTDGRYHEWLLEDCRLLYSPVGEGVPGGN